MRTLVDNVTLRYIESTFVTETALLQQARYAGEERVSGMQISPYEGKLLALLVRIASAANILEIGTFMGYSSLWMAQSLPENGRITTLESCKDHAAMAQSHFNQTLYPERFILKQGAALTTLTEIQALGHRYDVVFMDAAKKEYVAYLDATDTLLRDGGLIIADNTLLFGHMANDPKKTVPSSTVKVMYEFNKRLADKTRYDSILVPTEEGLTVAVKLPRNCNIRTVL